MMFTEHVINDWYATIYYKPEWAIQMKTYISQNDSCTIFVLRLQKERKKDAPDNIIYRPQHIVLIRSPKEGVQFPRWGIDRTWFDAFKTEEERNLRYHPHEVYTFNVPDKIMDEVFSIADNSKTNPL